MLTTLTQKLGLGRRGLLSWQGQTKYPIRSDLLGLGWDPPTSYLRGGEETEHRTGSGVRFPFLSFWNAKLGREAEKEVREGSLEGG